MSGPTPTFCPVFPEEFLREARVAVRRKTALYQSVQRYQLALLLHQEPYVPHEVAGQRVGLSGAQVRRWRKRWAAGDFSVADASGRCRSPFFPPLDQALVKAVACERVAETKHPLSRQSLADITARGSNALSKPISRSTVWRILDTDAIKPWRYKYWIFRVIPASPQRPDRFWTCMRAGGKANLLAPKTTSSVLTRRQHRSPTPLPSLPASRAGSHGLYRERI